ncbi:MAG: hypothetical protein IPM37_10535 [Hahellaceae bacterium]|nr:hypothetical protein [Hahellaceae bacterium]
MNRIIRVSALKVKFRPEAASIVGALTVGVLMCVGSVQAETAPLRAEKSTLETIQLKSLESIDLEEAGIPGSLSTTAAGESVEVPEALKSAKKNELEPRDTLEDLGRFNIPVQFIGKPDPMAVEGRTYNYDYIYRTPR